MEAELAAKAAGKEASEAEKLRVLLSSNGGFVGVFGEVGHDLLPASEMLTHKHIVALTHKEGWTRETLSRHGPELRNHFGVMASVPGLQQAYEAGGIWQHCDESVSHDKLPLGKTTHGKLKAAEFATLVLRMLAIEAVFDDGALDLASLPAAAEAAATAAAAQAAQWKEAEAAQAAQAGRDSSSSDEPDSDEREGESEGSNAGDEANRGSSSSDEPDSDSGPDIGPEGSSSGDDDDPMIPG